MPFQPVSGEHAILEVAIAITLQQSIGQKELEDLVKAHNRFKVDLPRIQRSASLQFVLGEGANFSPVQLPSSAPGVLFERIKPDGTIGWRLNVADNLVVVNCLDYSGWASVWPRARNYLSEASKIVVLKENLIVNLSLQYINVFEWDGDVEGYDVSQLVRLGTDYVPRNIQGRGPSWHLHQGWFASGDVPYDGTQLERVHMDGAMDQSTGATVVKLDTLVRADLASPLSSAALFRDGGRTADDLFNHLHIRDKELLGEFLTEDAAQRIKLNVG